ncbi:hypothetical protein AGDE_09480 [Angomonas deanei]|nr:hypothetical protein AGDE_09480 [Angomonas deanei]|eukprot:EPY30365.1 hypothetical protein AGDE_09480 [Angomonas deanei]
MCVRIFLRIFMTPLFIFQTGFLSYFFPRPPPSLSFQSKNESISFSVPVRTLLVVALLSVGVATSYQPTTYPIDWDSIVVNATTTRNLNSPYLGECVCDTTWGLCDINCCCDSDCSAETIELFEECLPETFGTPKIKYCYEYNDGTKIRRLNNWNGDVFIDKLEQGTSAVCVVRANHPESLYKYYKVPTSVSSPASQGNAWAFSSAGAGFRVGEAMQVLKLLTVDGASSYRDIGYFQFPAGDSRGSCRLPGVNVPFLSPVTSESCVLSGGQLCGMFPISSFINLFLFNRGSGQPSPTTVTPINVRIMATDGTLIEEIMPGSSPVTPNQETVSDGGICYNSVVKVNSRIMYNMSSDNRISSAVLELTVADVPQVNFVPLSFRNIFVAENATVPEFLISGNPGYILGAHLRAGTLMTDPSDPTRKAILEQIEGFLIPSGGRGCAVKNFHSVNFMQSVFSSGCYRSVTEQELMDLCATGSKSYIFSAINVSTDSSLRIIDHVASTSDALLNSSSDWIEIKGVNFTENLAILSYDNIQRKCSNIVVGIKFEFVVARAGVEYNPQDIIVGAFATPILGSWKIHNNSDFTSSAKSNIPIRFEVQFSRYDPNSQETIHRKVKAPPILPHLDDSIFYPFRKPYPL